MENPIKMDDLGVPPFLETPIHTHKCPTFLFFLVIFSGVDFPAVDWVVQLDCPDSVDSYIHRVGRTARYESPVSWGLMGWYELVIAIRIQEFDELNNCIQQLRRKELTILELVEEVSAKTLLEKLAECQQLWHRISGALQKMSF